MNGRAVLRDMYTALADRLGPSHWWPAGSPFEVMVGAVLTQNTSWSNVDKAITNLRAAGRLTPDALHALSPDELASLIQPSGFFRIKAARLHHLLDWLKAACGYDLDKLKNRDLFSLRNELLGVKGIGPETADCILCYALDYPSFVVDAYTRRIFSRHGLVEENIKYEPLRAMFMDTLKPDTALCNEYHALIVRAGKEWCRKSSPVCADCPLFGFLPETGVRSGVRSGVRPGVWQ